MKAHKVHVVRFYRPRPKAGHTLAYSENRKLLALSREDGTIEVYNMKNPNAPLLQSSIVAHGNELDRSVEALAFVKDGRLFSVGLHGFVYQHFVCSLNTNTSTLTPEFWPVTSGAAWCMKYNEKRNKLAIGTEEGFVCIFNVVPDGLDFDKILDKQEGRVLSLDWHVDGYHIITGSTDTLRLWDVESGHPLQRMSTGRVERNLETTVWSVLMLNDFTVVSGDSRGKVSFWKSNNGTLIDSYQSHKADVLTVTSNFDESIIYASGVDPTIVHFQPIKGKWMKSIQRYMNTHDVHAMLAMTGDVRRLVTVGVDANLFVDNSEKKSLSSFYPPFSWGNNVQLARQSAKLCLKHDQSIEIWSLGKSAASSMNGSNHESTEILRVTQEPVKELQIQCNGADNIHNFAVSPNAEFLAYCTKSKLKLFKLSYEPAPLVQKMDIDIEKTPHLLTLCDRNKLILGDTEGQISVFSLQDDSATLQFSHNFNVSISHLLADESGEIFIFADFENNITVFDLKQEKIQCKIVKYDSAPISCMAIHPKSKTLIVVYSDHHFVECCTNTGKYTKLTNKLCDNPRLLPDEWRTKRKVTKGILFPQSHLSAKLNKKLDTIMFYDEDHVAVLDRNSMMSDQIVPSMNKQAKKDEASKHSKKNENVENHNGFRMTKRYQHLVHMATMLPDKEEDLTCPIVAIEVRPQSLESQLPPSIRKKKFGAM